MKLLLDTNVLVRSLIDPDKLSAQVRERLESEEEVLLVSSAVVWEISIKVARHKIEFSIDPVEIVAHCVRASIDSLPITQEHAAQVMHLPPHHKDPFDRIMIAQAQHEALTIVTSDRIFCEYDVPVLLAG